MASDDLFSSWLTVLHALLTHRLAERLALRLRLSDLEQKLAKNLVDGLGLALSPEAQAKLKGQQEQNRVDAVSTMLAWSTLSLPRMLLSALTRFTCSCSLAGTGSSFARRPSRFFASASSRENTWFRRSTRPCNSVFSAFTRSIRSPSSRRRRQRRRRRRAVNVERPQRSEDERH